MPDMFDGNHIKGTLAESVAISKEIWYLCQFIENCLTRQNEARPQTAGDRIKSVYHRQTAGTRFAYLMDRMMLVLHLFAYVLRRSIVCYSCGNIQDATGHYYYMSVASLQLHCIPNAI
jgi:hypothetical protein